MRLLLKDKRFLLLSFLLLVVAASFWLLSRYPALDTKAMMAGSLSLSDGLSFDAWLSHALGERWYTEVLVTYANWLNTNKQGMLFGLLLAVILMTLLPVIKAYIAFKPNSFQSSLMGFVIGAPLGVCVNCAAPIAYGLYQRGARVEMAIATMISSPTFNFIVISMLLALFAWPVVLIKLAFTLLCVFVIVPLLVRLFNTEAYADTLAVDASCETVSDSISIADTTGMGSVQWVCSSLLDNACFLFLKVVPIMLLAGLLGSILVTLLPWDTLTPMLGTHGRWMAPLMMLVLAVFGLLLPVPITFDVILCATLLSAGVPIKYVATLLFVLGSFSIYSFMVLWKAGAKRIALGLCLSLTALGVLTGVATHYAEKVYDAYLQETVYSRLQDEGAVRHQVERPVASISLAELSTKSMLPLTRQWQSLENNASIQSLKFIEKAPTNAKWKLDKLSNTGFLYHPKTILHTSILPWNQLHSLAAGDVNNDQWIDLLVGTTRGLYLYLNTGGKFKAIAISGISDIDQPVAAIGLVDLNNDGWLDIFYNLMQKGSYISYSDKGQFSTPIQVLPSQSLLAHAVGFGDIDHNHELDIILGNYNGLGWTLLSGEVSRNQMLLQQYGNFVTQSLSGHPGETLSVLLSDLNQDSWLDLLIGNDFDEPDSYYWGQPDAKWQSWDKGSISNTTTTTMSIDSADINNDLLLDTYHAQITYNSASLPFSVKQRSLDEKYMDLCNAKQNNTPEVVSFICDDTRARMPISNKVQGCLSLKKGRDMDCIAAHYYMLGFKDKAVARGSDLETLYPEVAALYRQVFSYPRSSLSSEKQFPEAIPQQKDQNLLYLQKLATKKNKPLFIQQKKALGADIAGWSWNAKFADLDGDQWQDLFIVNGWSNEQLETENAWFQNKQGLSLVNRAEDIGLGEFEPTTSFVYLDYDNDGDLDIVTFSGMGILTAYTNNDTKNHHLQIQLDDHRGNRAGIGSVVTIYYSGQDDPALHQMREIKASGGFLSQDPAIAHFGLGEFTRVSSIDVRWSTGETSHYEGPFEAGQRYKILR